MWQLDGKKVVSGPIGGETHQLNASTFIVNVAEALGAVDKCEALI
jgi:hypothetical protein